MSDTPTPAPRRRKAGPRLNGADFVAVKRLSNRANETLADVGELCDQVPEESLGWLKEQGLIVPAPKVPAAPPPAEPPAPAREEE